LCAVFEIVSRGTLTQTHEIKMFHVKQNNKC
jgi:hypothetical protein